MTHENQRVQIKKKSQNDRDYICAQLQKACNAKINKVHRQSIGIDIHNIIKRKKTFFSATYFSPVAHKVRALQCGLWKVFVAVRACFGQIVGINEQQHQNRQSKSGNKAKKARNIKRQQVQNIRKIIREIKLIM